MGSRPKAPHVDHPYVFSVSQLETYDLCPRKWAFEKIDKLEREPNEYAQLGDRTHTVLEKYLKYGKPIDRSTREGKIAFPGLPHLPIPKTPGMRVEEWFVLKFGVAVYRGLKDVELLNREVPKVIDHKTTRHFKWKKSKQELKSNLQAGIYAADCMVKTGKITVEDEWIYYKTEGKPKAEPVKVLMTKELVEDVLTRANNIAIRMVDTLIRHKRALDVLPNYTACNAYGGCGFISICKPSPSKILKSIMSQKKEENMRDTTSAFLDDLRNRNNKKKTAKEKAASETKIRLKDVEAIPVNPPEREETKKPRPPAAKEVNGEWESPVWDEVEFQWVFLGEQKAAMKKKKANDITKDIGETKKGIAMSKNKGRKEEVEDLDDEEEEEEKPKKKSSKFASKDDEEDDEDEKPKKTKSKSKFASKDDDEDDDDDEDEKPTKSKSKFASKDDEDEDDDDEDEKPKKKDAKPKSKASAVASAIRESIKSLEKVLEALEA